MSTYLAPVQEAIQRGKREDIPVGCVYDTVLSHDQAFDNYVWLQPVYGKVLWIEFEEPAGSGSWRHYDRYYWARHGCVVSHKGDDLYDEHVAFYVDPRTKKINLRFWFEEPSGRVYSMAPTEHFYRLEADYFKRNRLCGGGSSAPHQDTRVCGPSAAAKR